MTVTLHLKPELEAGLLAKAQASGMPLEDHLLSLMEDAAVMSRNATDPKQPAREDAVRRMLEFGDKHHLSLGELVTRQLLHEGHRYSWQGSYWTPQSLFPGASRITRPRTLDLLGGFYQRLAKDDKLVPEIWAFEIANSIFVSFSKRKQIDESQSAEYLALLRTFAHTR